MSGFSKSCFLCPAWTRTHIHLVGWDLTLFQELERRQPSDAKSPAGRFNLNYVPCVFPAAISLLTLGRGRSFNWASVFPFCVMKEELDHTIFRFSSSSMTLWHGLSGVRWGTQERKSGWRSFLSDWHLPFRSIPAPLHTAAGKSNSHHVSPRLHPTAQLKVASGDPTVFRTWAIRKEDTPLRVWPLPTPLSSQFAVLP